MQVHANPNGTGTSIYPVGICSSLSALRCTVLPLVWVPRNVMLTCFLWSAHGLCPVNGVHSGVKARSCTVCVSDRAECTYTGLRFESPSAMRLAPLNTKIKYRNNLRTKQSILSARFYCALLTLHVSAPFGGHLQVVRKHKKNIQGSHYIFNGSVE
jgi:hypothetical protein